MAGPIERRHQIGQQQQGQRDQQQISDNAQNRGFWFEAMGVGRGLDRYVSMICCLFQRFQGANQPLEAELTKPVPSTIVPADPTRSSF